MERLREICLFSSEIIKSSSADFVLVSEEHCHFSSTFDNLVKIENDTRYHLEFDIKCVITPETEKT